MNNKISNFTKSLETDFLVFRPSKQFYKKVKINRKRFALLLRNQTSPTMGELETLSQYFNCSLSDLYEIPQSQTIQ